MTNIGSDGDALVLTLGHNSSAILVRENRIVAGYETERLTGVKSDSTFPLKSIMELNRRFGFSGSVDVYVSHWELFGKVSGMKPKHWDPTVISQVANGGRIFETNEWFTHHDAHAWSAILFAGRDFPSRAIDKTYIFVMDGFGTFGEHMSFYRLVDGNPVLLERKFGFGGSLGLLYQYTTAFMGMKQNQDEYKILAFEAGIDAFADRMDAIEAQVAYWSDFYVQRLSAFMEVDRTDPMLDLGALPNTASAISDMLNQYLVAIGFDSAVDLRSKRILCAYFVQKIVENVVAHFVRFFDPKNVLLVGGLFYNVKLNNMISRMVPGLTCIMPLAGDQGAGLGVYKAINPELEWPGHLYWGPRDLSPSMADVPGIVVCDPDEGFSRIAEELGTPNRMVNVVRGAMEFGPRALCHTSTLALPDRDVADRINFLNNRTNEMPFAPVMTQSQAEQRLEGCESIHRSLLYMICTRDFRTGEHLDMLGAAHRYPNEDRYSARPQITFDGWMIDLLSNTGPLINTSFNYHGVPIVCTDAQIINTHTMERTHSDGDGDPITVVIREEEQ